LAVVKNANRSDDHPDRQCDPFFSHRNYIRLSVYLCVTRVDQSKTVQAMITKSSPLAALKTLSGTVKLFHKFEGGHPEQGR